MQACSSLRRQRGVTLVEATVVMIVAAVVAAVAVYGFQGLQRRNEVQENIGLIIEVASELQRKFGINNQYGALSTDIAVRSRSIPPHLRLGTGSPAAAQNSYGGTITVAAVSLSGTDDAVALTWGNVPQLQCPDLVIGANNVARRITVGTTVVKPLDGVLAPAALVSACDAATRPNIVFDVGRMSVG